MRIVLDDAEITQTSYCRHDNKGKEIPIQYIEVHDTVEIDLDKMLSSYNKWRDIIITAGNIPTMKFSEWVTTKVEEIDA